jgi:hypothetical protein
MCRRMYTRGERVAQMVMVAVALVFATAVGGFIFRGGGGSGIDGVASSATPSASASTGSPTVTMTQDTCCTQTARFMKVAWTSSLKATATRVVVVPEPGFPCSSTLDTTGLSGVMTCQGLLKGATDYTATLSLTTARGTYTYPQKFKTMGDKLTGVQWFTEFEVATGDPLACAAASVRIVQNYTGGKDPLTATQILEQGKALNKSRDPGIDPVAIASMQKKLEPNNNYHYYRFTTREEATKSAIYWFVRSGKPVHLISLAGQHDPILVGFTGYFGTFYDDPANTFTQVIVQDPQRGDMRPETANRRPDKYRTPGFQTGQPLDLAEWYGDEWWFRFQYAGVVDGVNIDRNDGVYALPHWAGRFVIIVDDGDADWPQDKEGRVVWR